ncbi:hypothetical protein D0U04_26835 [Bacillus clarus]|uniref:Uncharacterized protein n=1 Tax=Bacillus clarus TaxID=2338372 RepID=A0A090Y9I0_9BACI|nr:hypothetical protein [Bacillus clarus]KFM95089.1 hypothetical protein DJ93_5744 [Bacillus clarus]RFT62920.1 hypothetical protein D0U04_26835 [Bacillus clarus]
MSWLVIFGIIFLLSVSCFESHNIHIIFKIDSNKKPMASWSFVNNINLQTFKELLTKRNKNIKSFILGELFIPLHLFNRVLSKTIIFLILFFYSQYLN